MFKMLAAVTVALLFCSCRSSLMDQDYLTGRQWLRELDNKSFTGFYLASDRRLLLIDDFSETGDQWAFKQDKLMLWKHTARNPEPREYGFYYELDGRKLMLRPDDGGDKLYFHDDRSAGALDVAGWAACYVYNPDNLPAPVPGSIRMRFDGAAGQLKGSIGDKFFFGKYQLQPPVGIGITELPEVGADTEEDRFLCHFLELLESADTFLMVRETLILYRGTHVLAAFHASYY